MSPVGVQQLAPSFNDGKTGQSNLNESKRNKGLQQLQVSQYKKGTNRSINSRTQKNMSPISILKNLKQNKSRGGSHAGKSMTPIEQIISQTQKQLPFAN